MATKAAEKVIDALARLMQGYVELQEKVQEDLGRPGAADGEDADDESDLGQDEEADAAVASEVKGAVEAFLDSEDFSSEEFAALISHLTGALEEIDPDVFASEDDLDSEEEYDYDDDDYELDDEEGVLPRDTDDSDDR